MQEVRTSDGLTGGKRKLLSAESAGLPSEDCRGFGNCRPRAVCAAASCVEEKEEEMKIHNIEDIVNTAKEMRLGVPAAVSGAAALHVIEPVLKGKQDGYIRPILIGDGEKIAEILRQCGEDPQAGYEIVDAKDDAEICAATVRLIKEKKAKIVIKGLIETGTLLSALLNDDTGIGKTDCVSACGLLELEKYHKLIAFSDPGVNTFPDLARKAGIIRNGVSMLHAIGVETPKVAVLSSIEKVNPKQRDTVEADELKQMNRRGEIEGCIVEGPISLDLAIQKESAEIKGYESPVAGDADLLVVPDILCGNMLIKGIGYFGDAKDASLVLGLEVPVLFGSRGGPIEGKYRSMALAAIYAHVHVKGEA